jgi:hypothetical protein
MMKTGTKDMNNATFAIAFKMVDVMPEFKGKLKYRVNYFNEAISGDNEVFATFHETRKEAKWAAMRCPRFNVSQLFRQNPYGITD